MAITKRWGSIWVNYNEGPLLSAKSGFEKGGVVDAEIEIIAGDLLGGKIKINIVELGLHFKDGLVEPISILPLSPCLLHTVSLSHSYPPFLPT